MSLAKFQQTYSRGDIVVLHTVEADVESIALARKEVHAAIIEVQNAAYDDGQNVVRLTQALENLWEKITHNVSLELTPHVAELRVNLENNLCDRDSLLLGAQLERFQSDYEKTFNRIKKPPALIKLRAVHNYGARGCPWVVRACVIIFVTWMAVFLMPFTLIIRCLRIW